MRRHNKDKDRSGTVKGSGVDKGAEEVPAVISKKTSLPLKTETERETREPQTPCLCSQTVAHCWHF